MSAEAVIARLRERDLLDIVQRQAAKAKVTVADVCGPSRERRVVRARHAAWADYRAKYGMSDVEIARLFGRDHTSVMHALAPEARQRRRVEVQRASDAHRLLARPSPRVALLGALRVI